MKQYHGLTSVLLGGAAILTIAQPAWSAPTQVTNVRLNPQAGGLNIVLETQAGDRPQVFAVNQGVNWTADVINTQLRLPQGNSFRQNNPAPGIASVTIAPLDANSVRVTVVGQAGPPVGQVVSRDASGLVFSLTTGNTAAAPTTPAGRPLPTAPIAQAPPATTPVNPGPTAAPAVPNPRINVTAPPPADPVTNPVPPLLPRAVPPPVGDIAVGQVDTSPSEINLGSNEIIPRLVLRDAPVRDVLSLLARAAGLNLAYVDSLPQDTSPAAQALQSQPQAGQDQAAGPRVSLDLENVTVQDVFNYVLRIADLESNRLGRTVIVGPRLPDDARNIVTRTLRLNQVPVASASGFLSSQGAASRISGETVTVQTVGQGLNQRDIVVRTPAILPLEAPQIGRSPLLLRGLSIGTDQRLNTITLVGPPRKVEIATALLAQLDARRRQVAVNVKVVDVNLLATEDFGTSFSFGIGKSFFSVDNGAAFVGYGGVRPPTNTEVSNSLTTPPVTGNIFPQTSGTLGPFLDAPRSGTPFGDIEGARPPFGTNNNPYAPGASDIQPPTTSVVNVGNTAVPVTTPGRITYELPSLFRFPSRLLFSLQAQVVKGNAKILTDPTLIVQEGENASVNLTQDVITNITVQNTDTAGGTRETREFERSPAGLFLGVRVDRIDDNGFVSLTVNPAVTAPTTTFDTGNGNITLLARRELQSGQVRLRDGQTLILSGIIQDTDRVSVSKVPILGDLPLLGSLFRRTNRNNQRQEVIILVTPQILDDSDRSSFGYTYTPGPEVRRALEQEERRRP